MIKKILFLVALIFMVVGCSNPTNTDYEIVETPKEEKPQDNTTEETTPNDNKEEEVVPPVKEDVVTLDTWRYNGSNIRFNSSLGIFPFKEIKDNKGEITITNEIDTSENGLNFSKKDSLSEIKTKLVSYYKKFPSEIETTNGKGYYVAWNVKTVKDYDFSKGTDSIKYVDNDKKDLFTLYPITYNEDLRNKINIENYNYAIHCYEVKLASRIHSRLVNNKDSTYEKDNPNIKLGYYPIRETDTNISLRLWNLKINNTEYALFNVYEGNINFSIDSDDNLVISENFVKL